MMAETAEVVVSVLGEEEACHDKGGFMTRSQAKSIFTDVLQEQLLRLEQSLRKELVHIQGQLPSSTRQVARPPIAARQPDIHTHAESTKPDVSSFIHSPACSKQRRDLRVTEKKTCGLKALTDNRGHVTGASELVHRLVVRNEITRLIEPKLSQYNERLIDKIITLVKSWNGISEPTRLGCVPWIVTSRWFEFLCIMMILVNSVFIALEADWEMSNIGQLPPIYFVQAECACGGFFVVELALRLFTHRLYYFVNDDMAMNIFDLVIVMISTVDLSLTMLVNSGENSNAALLRLLRVLKLAKVLRAVRAMRFFKDLAVIMEGLRSSVVALFWIFVMLGITIYVFSLIFMQSLIQYLTSDEGASIPVAEQESIKAQFGSIRRSAISLYMAVTGGNDWAMYYNNIQKAGALAAFFYLFFTFFFMFAMFNILTGLFVEKATAAGMAGTEEIVMAQRRKAHLDANELRHVCQYLDEDRSGTITWEEFQHMMSNPVMVAYMASIGLEVHEPTIFFSIICDHADLGADAEPRVTVDDFVDGCMHMKGLATSIDSQRHLFEIHLVQKALEQLSFDCQGTRERVEGMADQLIKQPERSTSPKLQMHESSRIRYSL